jgi:hypothetical protein
MRKNSTKYGKLEYVYKSLVTAYRIDSFESEGTPSEGIEEPVYAKSNIIKGTILQILPYCKYFTKFKLKTDIILKFLECAEQILRKGSRALPPGPRLCKECSGSLQS